ncbi:MAG TPA: hypothetical protein VGQ42_14015 [Candidatus Dormibacteraeota bacterium]|jgi:hypothetical protein|nr:hypothetical protein [Candidatus Dormibacteraeota bacterium]
MAADPNHDEPQGVVWAPWRVQIRDRIVRDEEDFARTPADRRTADPTNAAIVVRALGSARRHARLAYAGETIDRGERLQRLVLAFVTGAPIESAWLAVHRAEEALLMLMDDDAVRREVVQIRRAYDQLGLGGDDPRSAEYLAVLDAVGKSAPGSPVSQSARNALREIRGLIDQASDAVHAQRRALRNVLIALGAMCAVIALFLGIADHWWTSGLGLEPSGAGTGQSVAPNPVGAPGVGDVELVAGVGGLLSAIVALRNLTPYSGPFGLAIAQAILKVPAGAVTGYIGVLLMQRGLLGVVGPQDGPRVLGYAALFGFAQLAVTRLIDKRANEVLAGSKAAQDPATTPGGPAHPSATATGTTGGPAASSTGASPTAGSSPTNGGVPPGGGVAGTAVPTQGGAPVTGAGAVRGTGAYPPPRRSPRVPPAPPAT